MKAMANESSDLLHKRPLAGGYDEGFKENYLCPTTHYALLKKLAER